MIGIRQLSKKFYGNNGQRYVEVLREVDLTIAEGEFVAILGPSGCGKTTLLKIIGGLEPLSGGTVSIQGKGPSDARLARMFGFVSQHPVLLKWRTVLENVTLPAEIYRDHEIRRRAREWIELVGSNGFERSYPEELSGGMKARAALVGSCS